MKAKIDLEKLISSMLGYAEDNCEETMLDYLHSALQDQGLEYKDGEIVEIDTIDTSSPRWAEIVKECKHDALEQAKKFNKERLFEVAKQETQEKAEAEERKKTRKWLNFENTHEGITIPKDLKGTDTDGGVVGEKGEEGEPLIEDARIRKAILSGMNFLKFQGRETFGGIAIDDCIAWLKKQSIKEDSPETKAIKEQIENLKKRIEDNQLGCIVQRLDRIIELLQSAILILPKETYVPPIIYKRPLDPDPNVLGGWTTTASTFGSDYDIDTDKIK